ncbi:MAG TPA: hypothetical protein VLH08_21465 [Acidobacteriota bacterium]|nr:hypothetical protein [Acidobacteriota bacterium]
MGLVLRIYSIFIFLGILGVLAPFPLGAAVACNAPNLPISGTRIVNVSTNAQLQTAMGSLQAGDTIVIANGTYDLSSTLYVNGKNNVTIRGNSGCDNVVLLGNGMDNPNFNNVPHGVWSNSTNTTIAHLTIRDTWDNALIFNGGAQAPHVYSVKLLNAGSQFIKANPTDAANGIGVNDGVIEYSWLEYTNGPPATDHGAGVGYTNGLSAHAADNWIIRGNVFKDFHTPDTADYLWNPAVLMWNHSTNTLTERNTFINVDRAISYGLQDISGSDHSGGTIRNNFVYLQPGLMSAGRKAGSDGAFIIWDSPNTKVFHNTFLLNSNIFYSIEFRFASTTGGEARNNLSDLSIHLRDGATAAMSGNYLTATSAMFVNPSGANLHLQATATAAIDQAPALAAVTNDFDAEARPLGAGYDIGADEFTSSPPPPPGCTYCDDFEDGVLDPSWTYEKPNWTESNGVIHGVPQGKKAIAIASAFAGCQNCFVESSIISSGGITSKVWVFGWLLDKKNRMELLIREDKDRIVLKQRIAGSVVAKKNGTVTLMPNTSYVIRIDFDGTQFNVLVDGVSIFTMLPSGVVPSGTIGFQVSSTTADFAYITVD